METKIGLQLYSIRTAMEQDFLGSLAKVRAAGYDWVEFAGFGGFSAGVLKAELDRIGLEPYAAHIGYDQLDKHLDEVVSYSVELGMSGLLPGYRSGRRLTAAAYRISWSARPGLGALWISGRLPQPLRRIPAVRRQVRSGPDLENDAGVPVVAEVDVCWAQYADVDPVAYIDSLASSPDRSTARTSTPTTMISRAKTSMSKSQRHHRLRRHHRHGPPQWHAGPRPDSRAGSLHPRHVRKHPDQLREPAQAAGLKRQNWRAGHAVKGDPMSDKIFKVGIIGCGGIANGKHMPALKKAGQRPDGRFLRYHPGTAAKAAAEYGTPDAVTFTDFRKLVALPGLDVIHVLTPNKSHAPISIAALEAASTSCAKSDGQDGRRCKAMVEAAKRTGKKLTIGYQSRHRSDSRYLKQLIEEAPWARSTTPRPMLSAAAPSRPGAYSE